MPASDPMRPLPFTEAEIRRIVDEQICAFLRRLDERSRWLLRHEPSRVPAEEERRLREPTDTVVRIDALVICNRHMSIEVPVEMIRAKRTQGAAFTLACDSSGLDDKEIYLQLKVDAGTFSRIKKGANTLPGDLLKRFCEIVGNTIYPEWLAYQVGCGLVLIQSEAERRIAELELALASEREKRRYAEDLAVRRMA